MCRSQIALWNCFFAVAFLCGCQKSDKDDVIVCPEGPAEVDPATAAAAAKAKDPNRGFESPEAVWTAYSTAERERDTVTVIATHTDDSQKVVAAQTIIALGFAAAFNEESMEPVKALMKKHGIDPDNRQPPPGIDQNSTTLERFQAMAGVLHDPVVFIIEANAFIQALDHVKQSRQRGQGELLDVVVDGDTATATLKERRGRRTVGFRKETGGWLVEITESQVLTTLSGVTTNGSGNLSGFGMDRNKHTLPPLEAISLANVQNAWKLSADYQQQTAQAALQDITKRSGLKIHDQPELADALQKKVDVKLDDVSAVQVIEEICRQVDLQPRYKPGAMALWEGSRKLPIAFAGPFLVEVTKTQESIPNAFVRIDLQYFAAGLPTPVCSRLTGMYISDEENAERIVLTIPKLQGTNGASLNTKTDIVAFPAKGSASSVQFKASVEVSRALRAVDNIAPFDGSFAWMFPQQIKTVTFEDLQEGESRDAGDAKLTIGKVRTGAQMSVSFELDGVTHKELVATALDADGKPIEASTHVSGYTSGGKSSASVSIQGAAQQLQIRIMQDVQRVEFTYQLPEIPLTFHIDQPEQLEPVEIEGDVPVKFEFVRVKEENNFRSTIFEWTNQSNKDVRSVKGKLEFLDTAGAVIKKQNINQGSNTILLDYAESEETTLFGRSPPEETATTRITLTEVEFTDSTMWAAEEK